MPKTADAGFWGLYVDSGLKILDIGCGKNKFPGSLGVDLVRLSGVDVVCDLNRFPYPFLDGTFDRIYAIHLIEHLQSIPRTMEEIHRIGKPGAVVEIVTPHYTDASSWQDPTHCWHLNSRSFDLFEEEFRTSYYSQARFEILRVEIKLLKLFRWMGLEFLVNLENRHAWFRWLRRFWEQYLCFLVRGKLMTFRLRIVK